MYDVWTSAGAWMLNTAIGGGIVLLLTCLAMPWIKQPARRQRLGECGVAAALLVALGCAIGPSWFVVAWSRSDKTSRATTLDSPPALTQKSPDALGDPVPDPTLIELLKDHLAIDASVPAEDELAKAEHVPVLAPISSGWMQWTWACLVIALFLAAAFFALRLLIGYLGLLCILRRSETAPADVRGLFETMSAGARWLRLLVSQRLLVPLSCGLWRPSVVLPATMCEKPQPQQLRWIFAHELTHLRRRDAWSGLLLNLGEILFFALPWYWWLRRQVRLCQEYIADAAAAGENDESADYAEFLVSLAKSPAVPIGASGVSGNTSDLYRRVTMLLKNPLRVESSCPRLWTWLVAGGLLALAVLMSGFEYRAEAAPDEQVVIVVRSGDDKGQADKKLEFRVELPPDIAAKIDQDKDVIIWRHISAVEQKVAGQADPTNARIILWDATTGQELTPPGGGTKEVIRLWDIADGQERKSIRQWQTADGKELRFIDGVHVEWVAKDGAAWMVQPGDNLAPLRKAMKLLEELNSKGKLTHEQIQVVITQALKEMKVQPVNPVVEQPIRWEKVVDKFKVIDKDAKSVQILMGVADLQKLLAELEKMQITTKEWSQLQSRRLELQKGIEQDRLLQLRKKNAIGLELEAINPRMALHLKLPANVGLLVKNVTASSPADKAGIKVDDILVKLAGGYVPGTSAEFYKLLGNLKTDTPLDVVVLRKGEMLTAGKLTLSSTKGEPVAQRLYLLQEQLKKKELEQKGKVELELKNVELLHKKKLELQLIDKLKIKKDEDAPKTLTPDLAVPMRQLGVLHHRIDVDDKILSVPMTRLISPDKTPLFVESKATAVDAPLLAKESWSKWGVLKTTDKTHDGQSLYRLEDDNGTPICFALTKPGLTLEPYVGRKVCLYGVSATSGTGPMHFEYIVVSNIVLSEK